MTDLQRADVEGGAERDEAMQNEFRRLVLRRVHAYLAGTEVGPFEDHSTPVWPLRQLAAIVEHSSFLGTHVPWFAAALRSVPGESAASVERFLYWSKERIADRAIVSVTDVHILRSEAEGVPEVLVAGKGIFSTHYVDVLRGMFGGLIRWVIQRRLKAEAGGVLLGLRQWLESGEPPAPVTSTRWPGTNERYRPATARAACERAGLWTRRARRG